MVDDARGDICAGRHGGAETSVEAFRSTSVSRRTRQRERVMEYIISFPSGVTCEEVSDGLSIPYTAASARISELRKADRIHSIQGRTRLTKHGKPARLQMPGPAPVQEAVDA